MPAEKLRVKILPITLTIVLACLGIQAVRAEEVTTGSAIAPEAPLAETTTAEMQTSDVPPGAVVIEGDRMQIYLDRKLKASGDAALHSDKQNIYGDNIDYDIQNAELHVIGNTRIEYSGSTIVGPELRLRLDESVGEMKEPSFRLNSLPQRASSLKSSDSLTNNVPNSSSIDSTESPNTPDVQSFENSADIKPHKRPTASRGDAKTVLFEGEGKKRWLS